MASEDQFVKTSMIRINLIYLFAVLAFGIPQQLFAVSESELEFGYMDKMREFMVMHGAKGALPASDGVIIRYSRFDKECNGTAIILVPGWSEPYMKYVEVIYDLAQKNYCIYTFDHRGQGLSSRTLKNSQIGHVDDFTMYVEDLAMFDEKIVRSKSHKQVYILAHSMGGLVATLYASNSNSTLNGLVLIAPMFEIKTDFWPEWVALSIANTLDWAGYGHRYVLGHGNWTEKPFTENRLTHSFLRYQYGVALFRENPALVVGGVSNRWLKTSIVHGQKIDKLVTQFNRKVLLFQAGIDEFVKKERQDRFCEYATNCEKVFFKEAKHELLMERDSVRNEVFNRIFEFIESNQP